MDQLSELHIKFARNIALLKLLSAMKTFLVWKKPKKERMKTVHE